MVAYGALKLKPEELYALTPLELEEMLDAHEKQELKRRWETAYWVSHLMSIHTKKVVKPDNLMKPFLPQKTAAEIKEERAEFFKGFELQRKGETNGNSS